MVHKKSSFCSNMYNKHDRYGRSEESTNRHIEKLFNSTSTARRAETNREEDRRITAFNETTGKIKVSWIDGKLTFNVSLRMSLNKVLLKIFSHLVTENNQTSANTIKTLLKQIFMRKF